jgi:hypothetical protein
MTGSDDHQVQIIASTLEEIRNLLGTTGDFSPGAEIEMDDGLVVLRDARVSRSSGFDGTQYLLEGVMTVGTGTSSGVLTAWLMDRLRGQDRVTAIVDGEEIGPVPPGERS